MRKLLWGVGLCLAGVLASWGTGGTPTLKTRDGTTIGVTIAADDTLAVAGRAIFTGTSSFTNLGVTGTATLAKLSVTTLEVAQSDSSTVYGLDTTLTGVAAYSRLALPYDERDPNRLGRYTETGTLVSDLVGAITDELAGAVWRDEGLKWPVNGIIQVSVKGDTIRIRDGNTGTKVLDFNGIAGGVLTTATPGITDVAYLDRTLYVTGVDSVGLTRINLRTGVVDKWLASGYWKWNGALSERNSNKGWTLVSATPALNDARVNSVGVMRSPWSSPSGHYVTVGTLKGTSSWIMAANGAVSIYDAVQTSPVRDVEMLPDGQVVGVGNAANLITGWTNSGYESAAGSGANLLLGINSSGTALAYTNGVDIVSGTVYRVRMLASAAKGAGANSSIRLSASSSEIVSPRLRTNLEAKFTYIDQRFTADTTATFYWMITSGLTADTVRVLNLTFNVKPDSLYYTQSALATTADSRAPDAIYRSGATGGLGMPFDSTASLNAVAALPHASAAGRDGSRIFAGMDSGLVVIDQKPGDASNGFRQIIRKNWVGLPVPGDVRVAFSAGYTADVSGRGFVGVFDTTKAPSLKVVDATSPTGYYVATDSIGDGLVSAYSATGLQLTSGAVDSALTIAAWVKKPATYGALAPIIGTSPKGVSLQFSTHALILRALDGASAGYINCTADINSISSALPRQWMFVVGTYSGNASHTGLKLYLNGELLATTNSTSGSYTAMQDTAKIVSLMSETTYDGRTESLAGAWIAKGALTAPEVKALYRASLPFIETPTPDVLTVSNRIQFTDADWLSGRTLVGDSSRVELRHSTGALLDTFLCTGCGQLYSAKFKRSPSADSLNIVIAGATGLRVIGQNPRLTDYAASEWPREEYWIGLHPAVVDSSGQGNFWTGQDAINACYAVGKRAIQWMRGTYNDPVTEVYTGMQIEGVGSPLLTNVNLTTSPALTVATGDSVSISGMRFYTATGGAGGNQDAFSVTAGADHGVLRNCQVVDADDDGFAVSAGQHWTLVDCDVVDADDQALQVGNYGRVEMGNYVSAGAAFSAGPTPYGKASTTIMATFSGADSPAIFAASADTARLSLCKVNGDISVAAGATKAVIANNQIMGSIVDGGTGTITDNNAQ